MLEFNCLFIIVTIQLAIFLTDPCDYLNIKFNHAVPPGLISSIPNFLQLMVMFVLITGR